MLFIKLECRYEQHQQKGRLNKPGYDPGEAVPAFIIIKEIAVSEKEGRKQKYRAERNYGIANEPVVTKNKLYAKDREKEEQEYEKEREDKLNVIKLRVIETVKKTEGGWQIITLL